MLPSYCSAFVASGRWDRGKGFWTTPAGQRVPASVRARYESWSANVRAVAPLTDSVELQANVLAFDDNRTLRFKGGDTGTSGQDASSVGIMFAGDFADMPPTPLQLDRGAQLVAWLAQELKIPNSRIVGHDELPGQSTSCPGRQWLEGQQWKQLLFERVQAWQGGITTAPAKFIEHYLLLWWRGPDLWAEPDYRGAVRYVARFTPTVGFSLAEAKTARFVTIVGGPGGVPANTEEALRAAGVLVERIAGKDYIETQRLLDELAAAGRRFRSDELASYT